MIEWAQLWQGKLRFQIMNVWLRTGFAIQNSNETITSDVFYDSLNDTKLISKMVLFACSRNTIYIRHLNSFEWLLSLKFFFSLDKGFSKNEVFIRFVSLLFTLSTKFMPLFSLLCPINIHTQHSSIRNTMKY